MSKKIYLLVVAGSLALAGPAFAIYPIKGSLTFVDGNGNSPSQNMTFVPGQSFTHRFLNEATGPEEVEEFYKVNNDGTLLLVSRRPIDNEHSAPEKVEKVEKSPVEEPPVDVPK
jgi:hypothetical protein